MQIERREEQNGLALLLRGRLDAGRCRILEDELEDAIRQGFHRIVLDMDEVLFLSSAGIRSLLRYKRTLTALGGDLAIRRPSEFVQEILNMVGMTAFFVEGDATAPTHAAEKITRFDLGAGSFRVELLGAGEARSFGSGNWGFGIGSFEKERCDSGEVLAAEGFALMLPPGDGQTPDFMAASGDFVPSVHFASGVVLQGAPSCCLRFSESLPGMPLSELVALALDAVGAPAAALALVAETSGLVGASLSVPGPKAVPDEGFFAFPAVREHLDYRPEKRFDRHLAVVVGLAVRGDAGTLAPQVRPLAGGEALSGHFHAAVFPFKAIPQGRVELPSVLAKLFDAVDPVGLLHLLHDRRPISGAGESAFLSGALWAGALAGLEGGRA